MGSDEIDGDDVEEILNLDLFTEIFWKEEFMSGFALKKGRDEQMGL